MGIEGMGVWELPAGWDIASLGEVAPANASQVRPADFPEQEFRYLGLGAVESGGWIEPSPELVKGVEVRSNCIQFDSRHVLYAKLRPYLNKVVVPTQEGVGSTEFVPLVPDANAMTREFLAWYLRSPQFVEYAVRNSTGARMPRTRMSALWEAEIPLPRLDVQRRIVARVEELFARIEEARRLRADADEDAEQLMLAALVASFDGLRGGVERTEPLGSLVSEMRNGMSKRTWVEPPDGIASLNIGNVTQHDFSVDSCRRVLFDPERHAKYLCREGDLLVCNVNGSPQLVGAVAVLPGTDEPMVFDHNITRLRLEPDIAPRFVAYHLREPATRVAIEARFGTSSGQSYLPQKKLATIPILVPPLAEQCRVVEYLDNLKTQLGDLRRAQEITATELERLEQCILARAFRGELV